MRLQPWLAHVVGSSARKYLGIFSAAETKPWRRNKTLRFQNIAGKTSRERIVTSTFRHHFVSDYILVRNCLFRLYPSQELSFQTTSFSGTVFSDNILLGNYLIRLNPCSGTVFSDLILCRNVFKAKSFEGTVESETETCQQVRSRSG